MQLLRTAESLWNASRVFFTRWGLSPSQFNVLNLVAGAGEVLPEAVFGGAVALGKVLEDVVVELGGLGVGAGLVGLLGLLHQLVLGGLLVREDKEGGGARDAKHEQQHDGDGPAGGAARGRSGVLILVSGEW